MEKQLKQVNKTAMQLFDNSVGEVLQNHFVSYGLKIVLVLYAAFMANNTPAEVSSVLNHSLVRFFLILCIVYLAGHYPVLAIVASIAYVISIQNMNSNKVTEVNQENYYNPSESFTGENDVEGVEAEQPENHEEHLHENFEEHAHPEGHSENNQLDESFSGMVPPQGSADGCSGAYFTSDTQLSDAQTNELSGQSAEVKTWSSQLGPQGTSTEPYGHNVEDGVSPAEF